MPEDIPASPSPPFSFYRGRFTYERQEERDFAGSSRVLGQTPFRPLSWPLPVAMSGERARETPKPWETTAIGGGIDNVAAGLRSRGSLSRAQGRGGNRAGIVFSQERRRNTEAQRRRLEIPWVEPHGSLSPAQCIIRQAVGVGGISGCHAPFASALSSFSLPGTCRQPPAPLGVLSGPVVTSPPGLDRAGRTRFSRQRTRKQNGDIFLAATPSSS